MAPDDLFAYSPGNRSVLDMLPPAFWSMGLYRFTLGLWAFWRSRQHFVLTNQRLLVYRSSCRTGDERYPLTGPN